jgi:DNA repair exonuclease SbcCD ATPase subunit
MSKANFIWAKDIDANVREPISELTQKGWQHRDIPKASNMNWIFKQISDEFAALRKELEVHTVELKNQLEEQTNGLKEQKKAVGTLKTELHSLGENHVQLKSYTKRGLGKAYRGNDFNNGITRGISERLRNMEQAIRHYHPGFPEFHWPLQDHATSRINDIEEENS